MALRWIKRFLTAVAVALFLVVISAVIVSGSSAGGTLRSGRSVVAKSDSIYCSCTFGDDTATIKTGRKEIVVNPTSLVVDGVVMAEIDKNVARVQISLKRGVVTFVADGVPVDTALRYRRRSPERLSMIAACASRYTDAAEPLIVRTRHGQLILYMMDGTGSWGSGVEAASWFRDWLADTHMDDLRASPTTVSETLRAGIRQLPPAIRDDDDHWSFSIVAVIADDDTIQLGACGGFAAAAVSGTHIAHLLTPARLIDELVAEGHVPESEAEGHKYAHVLCGPFFGVDDHDKLTWLPPVAKAAQSLILIGECGLHRYLAAQRDHNLHIDPVALRDAVEAFSGRSSPTAVIDGV